MKNKSLHAVLTRFGIIAAILATLLVIAPAASADETVMYAENGTDPVATFSATDPEGDSITWKLEGANGVDNADFEIGEDTGVLTFKSPPNYESPTDRDEDPDSDIDQGVGDRMYKVSITANGGDAFVLTVEVTNEDEPGSVSLDKPQPQVGRPLAAIDFDDPDGTDEKTVQWYSGPDKDDGPWTDLEVTNESYTPKAADAGNYLRVVYTYNDSFGDGKMAEAVSENVVEDKTLSNARPVFDGKDALTDENNPGFQVSLTSKEGAAAKSNIGDPVSATDEDNDTLRYSIVADAADAEPGTDDEKFSIDAKSGQLKVGSKALDFEPAGSVGANGNGDADQMYVVTVRVVDPSGAFADADVTITLEDVNEPPIFNDDSDKLTTLHIAENIDDNTEVFKAAASVDAEPEVTDDTGDDVSFTAVDDDPADAVTYSLEGGDATKFAVDAQGGGLTKLQATAVDFETKSSYSIAVIAKSSRVDPDDSDKMIDMFDRVVVTVKVVNNNDPGVVSFTQREPQVGSSVGASIDDLDGDVTNLGWQWYRLTAADAGNVGTNQFTETTVTVNCVAETVGDASCVIDKATSASYTPTQYDYLADNPVTTADIEGRYLAARATYNDKFNAAGVTQEIYFGVTDADVQEDNPANSAPEFKDQDRNVPGVQDETVTREVKENTDAGTSVGDAFTAEDPNDDLLIYELEGPDADSFQLSDPESTGSTINLQTKGKLDYETKAEYTVTIKAMDPSGADDTITVTVMVTGVNEGAAIDEVETVMYAENGEDPVATFTATDPEGDAITWKLGAKGVDNGKFEIGEDDGVLTFKDSPDFESAGDGDEEPDSVISQGVEDNVYKVSVTANGGSPFVLTVEVTNEDEPGSVSLDKPQPQVGRPLAAIDFDDPDGADEETVQWYSGPDKDDGPWTDLEVTNESYTPKAADAGNYLRVVYTYNDSFGDGKMAEAVSENVVEDKTLSNARPVFDGKDALTDENNPGFQVSLTSKEGAAAKSNIGDPVSATDEDNDTLRYSIVADAADAEPGTDDEKFSIDAKSGQLKVGSKALDFEPAGSVGANGNGDADQMYVVTVRVVDPSGAFADADVTITLEDVNEPPIFNDDSDKLTTLHIAENTDDNTEVFKAAASVDAEPEVTDDTGDDVSFTAVDDDPADAVTYSLEGGDATKFAVDAQGGGLTKLQATAVDFETKSSYSIAVIAKSSREDPDDSDKMIDMFDRVVVTVKVVNNNDPGVVSFTQREPQVGSSVGASVDDMDGGVSYVAWQWYRLTGSAFPDPVPADFCPAEAVGDDGCVIEKATSASYTPTQYDIHTEGRYLAAQATYNDKFNTGDNTKVTAEKVSDAPVEVENPANTAPEFKDQDRNTPGMQDEAVTREVEENTEAKMNIGDGFSGEDGDQDLLMYTLGGPDADSFGLSDPSGISNSINLLTKAPLDYETKTEYTVTIKAMDPSGASDMITVTVMVTDVNEGSTISFGPANTVPAFADDAETDFMVDENMPAGTSVGTVMADDADGDVLTYTDDSMYFDVDDMGNITTAMMLDHEAMPSHTVIITATDSEDASDSIDVTVMVIDVPNNAPAFDAATADRMVDENMPAGTNVGDPVTATDEGDDDDGTLAYSLSGDGAMYFVIDDMGQISTEMMLDYESMASHMVTVTATDSEGETGSIMVTVTVGDVDEMPMFEREAAEFSVEENVPVGTVVGTETAMLVESYTDDSDYFDVDGMGNITTAMMLDYESGTTSYMVTVTATGTDGSTDTIEVTVTVGDAHPGCTVADNNSLTNDCEALLDAKGDLGGSLNWDTDTVMDDWEGVTMSDGRVSGIWLRDEGLDGSVSAALGRLDMLTVLNLHSNSLSGTIPDLSGASMLEELYLAGNADYVTNDDGKKVKKVKVDGTGLTGEIPMWLNGMTNMRELWLWGNSLSGGIPDLSGMTSLDKLKLADNDLTGNINAMYLPQNVSWLIIDRNGFDGSMPDLSGLASLELLWLHSNELTGSVPDGTMLPASLDDLNLRDNMLTGAIPDLSALDNLTRLRLHNNSLSGAVPGSLGGLDSLKQLWLHNEEDSELGNNMFTSIDDGVGDLAGTLIEIALSGNPWADDACVPAELAGVEKNDYEAAGIDVCGADDGS